MMVVITSETFCARKFYGRVTEPGHRDKCVYFLSHCCQPAIVGRAKNRLLLPSQRNHFTWMDVQHINDDGNFFSTYNNTITMYYMGATTSAVCSQI